MERGEPILAVFHHSDDGAWSFIGGPWQKSDLVIVCLSHAAEHDPTVVELADLPRGWAARRDGPDEPWERYEDTDDEEKGDDLSEAASDDPAA
jgi:hypothetical protein